MANPSAALAELNRVRSGAPDHADLALAGAQSVTAKVDSLSTALDKVAKELKQAINTRATGQDLKDPVSSVLGQITAVSKAVSGIKIPETDLSPIERKLEGVSRAVASIHVPPVDLTEVLIAIQLVAKGIDEIEVEMPNYDERLAAIEQRLEALEQPRTFEHTVERINSLPNSPIKKITSRQV